MSKDYKKLYEEALERAKYLKENTDSVGAKDISYTFEYIFPELKENEDESIREALINGFNKLNKSAVWYNGITNAQILDWLEKQGEKIFVTTPQLIKEEIERRYNCEICYPNDKEANVAAAVLQELLLFIDSLPEEHNKDLEEEIQRVYRQNREYGNKMNMLVILNERRFKDIACHFAEWQKQRLMKDAVEAESCTFSNAHGTFLHIKEGLHTKDGDKVKIFIVKTE